NKELLESCRPLADYSLFVDSVRKYSRGYVDKGDAVKRAIKDLPSDSALKKYLKAHEAEVMEMCLTEYNEKEERELLRQEALEIGREEGREEGRTIEAKRIGSLMLKLKDVGRVDDAFRAASDSVFRESLYKEFGL
ncbi:MAG: hypothetical protein J5800_03135, partial [Spirochaetales bacterium]|nr:hypothetical protein [Spirochaetales bacterium]